MSRPKSCVGGPLALVRDGDLIELDVAAAASSTCWSATRNWPTRRSAWTAPPPSYERGYGLLYLRHVSQADEGCDFDFLEPTPGGAPTPDPEIH